MNFSGFFGIFYKLELPTPGGALSPAGLDLVTSGYDNAVHYTGSSEQDDTGEGTVGTPPGCVRVVTHGSEKLQW